MLKSFVVFLLFSSRFRQKYYLWGRLVDYEFNSIKFFTIETYADSGELL